MDNLVIENKIVVSFTEPDILQIEIPEGIVAISNNAFCNLKRLFSVTLPKTLLKIGDGAFENCSSLKSINLENVSVIGERAFCGCTSLSDINFGEKIGYLCNGAFSGCISIEKIKIPNNIAYIGCECFKDCTELSEIELLGVMEIDNNAFEHCTSLYSLILPKSLLHIAENAFSFCENLKSVTIQNRYIDIDEKAFENDVNIIIKAVQYSTAYHYALSSGFSFCPSIIKSEYRVITSEQAAILSKSGILFRMKLLEDDTKGVIIFDKSVKDRIDELIGGTQDEYDGRS